MRINISRELCIGAAPCVAIAGNVFQMDDEGKAILVGPSTDDANTRLAAEACPTRAIFLYENNGTQIFPPVEESPRAYVPEAGQPAATDVNIITQPVKPAAANDNAITPAAKPAAANDNASPDIQKAA